MSDVHEEVASPLQWSEAIDTLLASWCDEAKCFEWMHTESYHMFESRSRMLMISSNVLTSVSGLVNLIVGGVSVQGFQTSWIFGTVSILISITNMLQEKLGYSKSAIEHRSYATAWSVVRRKIEEELVIPRSSRKQCATFLKFVREDINKVSLDGNTKIPESILDQCLAKFGSIDKFSIPEICGKMEHTKIFVEDAKKPLLEANSSI